MERISRTSASPFRSGNPMSTMTASTPPGMRRSLFSASAAETAVSTLRPASSRYSVGQHLNQRLILDDEDTRRRRSRIDDVAQFFTERRLGEGLGQKLDARIEPPVMHDGIARIAGGEQHLQIQAPLSRFLGKLAAVHAAGKPDVGNRARPPRDGPPASGARRERWPLR